MSFDVCFGIENSNYLSEMIPNSGNQHFKLFGDFNRGYFDFIWTVACSIDNRILIGRSWKKRSFDLKRMTSLSPSTINEMVPVNWFGNKLPEICLFVTWLFIEWICPDLWTSKMRTEIHADKTWNISKHSYIILTLQQNLLTPLGHSICVRKRRWNLTRSKWRTGQTSSGNTFRACRWGGFVGFRFGQITLATRSKMWNS